MARTRVSVLEYPLEDGSGVMSKEFTTSPALNHHLTGLAKQDSSEIKLRLYVVEDLSRDVIEALGGHYDVNPSFFREHIADNVWHNISEDPCSRVASTRCLRGITADAHLQRTGGVNHRIST